MATIASAKSSNGKYKVWIEYSYTQNKTANTSSVTGTGYIQRADGYNGASAYNNDKRGYIKIGGTQYNGPKGIDTRYLKKAKLGSGTKTITHNSSTGAATCAFVVYCPYLASSCPATTGSGTLTLPTIPRTPTLNSTDVLEVYSTSIVINWASNMSVNMVRYSTNSSFSTYKDVSDSGTSGTLTLTIDPATGKAFVPGQKYIIYVKVRASASNLWSSSKSAGYATTCKYTLSHTTPIPYQDNAQTTISWTALPSTSSYWSPSGKVSLVFDGTTSSVNLTGSSTKTFTRQGKSHSYYITGHRIQDDAESVDNWVTSSTYNVSEPADSTLVSYSVSTDNISANPGTYAYVNHSTKMVIASDEITEAEFISTYQAQGYQKYLCSWFRPSTSIDASGQYYWYMTINGKDVFVKTNQTVSSTLYRMPKQNNRYCFLVGYEDSSRFKPASGGYQTIREMLQKEFSGSTGTIKMTIRQFGYSRDRDIIYTFNSTTPSFPSSVTNVVIEEKNQTVLDKGLQRASQITLSRDTMNSADKENVGISFIAGASQFEISGLPAIGTVYDSTNNGKISGVRVTFGGLSKSLSSGATSITINSNEVSIASLQNDPQLKIILTEGRTGKTFTKTISLYSIYYTPLKINTVTLDREETVGEKVSVILGGTSGSAIWRGLFRGENESGQRLSNELSVKYRYAVSGQSLPAWQDAFFVSQSIINQNTSGVLDTVTKSGADIVPSTGGITGTVTLSGGQPSDNPATSSQIQFEIDSLPGDTETGFNSNNSYQIQFLFEDILSSVTLTGTILRGLGPFELYEDLAEFHSPVHFDPAGTDSEQIAVIDGQMRFASSNPILNINRRLQGATSNGDYNNAANLIGVSDSMSPPNILIGETSGPPIQILSSGDIIYYRNGTQCARIGAGGFYIPYKSDGTAAYYVQNSDGNWVSAIHMSSDNHIIVGNYSSTSNNFNIYHDVKSGCTHNFRINGNKIIEFTGNYGSGAADRTGTIKLLDWGVTKQLQPIAHFSEWGNLILGDNTWEANTHLYAPVNVNIYSGQTQVASFQSDYISLLKPCRMTTDTIYDGALSVGSSANIPKITSYDVFLISDDSIATIVFAIRWGNYLRGIGGYAPSGSRVTTYAFSGTLSGTTLTVQQFYGLTHDKGTGHNSGQNYTVGRIIALH